MSDVKTDTGFEVATLQYIWDKYNAWNDSPGGGGTFGGRIPQRRRDGAYTAFYFYLVFVYIHKCPQRNWLESYASADRSFKACRQSFDNNVFPIAEALAQIIDEIDYDRRLSHMNHPLPPFDRCFTGIVDTLPVYLPTPHNWHISTLFFQPKYKHCVLKMQLGCAFTGDIILWTGPHLGVTSDSTIWDTTWPDHPFYPWERWLADLGYVGCAGLICKYKKPTRGHLTWPQQLFNNVQESTRNRVENVVGAVKEHRLFKVGNFRGTLEHLEPLLRIVGHVTAHELSNFQRFDSYGPWPHNN